ncbi:MAG: hypothetical protein H6P99_740 [Holophagaceae bacterium]|nr:hypothetical protein [Holophagaceae bacterium]
MQISDRELAIVGLWASVIPTTIIVYFDWKRRRADRYIRARNWLTTCTSQLRGFVFISCELYNVLTTNLSPNLELIESVEIGLDLESQRFMVNKAQDIFLSRDPLRQLDTAWQDLGSKARKSMESMPPFVFNESELLMVHAILQKYQDGGKITYNQLVDWRKANLSFGNSLQIAIDVMSELKCEINKKLPLKP